jgi:hypothetical protein
MEGYFYTNLLGSILDLSGRTSSWVGSIRYDNIDMNIVGQMISDKTLIESGIEVISFFDPLSAGESLQVQSDDAHPGLMNLLEYVLESVGESKEDINTLRMTSPDFKGIFGYSFVARSDLLPDFVQWISRVVLFVTTNAKAQEMAWKDSRYGGSQKAMQELFGSPFYPFHPFFGERLFSFYFNARGYKIITLNNYNTRKTHVSENQDEASLTLEYV